MNTKVQFHDVKGNLATIEIRIENYFAMSGEYDGSAGQCLDRIYPRTKDQIKLIELWNRYHLKEDYPKNIEDTVNKLIDRIRKDEKEFYHTEITEELSKNNNKIKEAIKKVANDLDVEAFKILAICIELNVTLESLLNGGIEYNGGNIFFIEGNEYMVCTDKEAEEEHLEYMENLVDDIGFEAFNNPYLSVEKDIYGNIIISQSVTISDNERGNSLASYDGKERWINVLGVDIYLYRR